MKYVEAPGTYAGPLPKLFLAGGISDCPDWQADAVTLLEHVDAAVFNPRRVNFAIHDPHASAVQVAWEFEALAAADVVLFWFASGPSVQPIALYELGAHAADQGKPVVVGCDPGYLRRQDVLNQLGMVRPGLKVWDRLELVCTEAALRIGERHVRADAA